MAATDELVNALTGGSFISNLAHPNVVNPMATYANALTTARSVYDLRQKQAEEATGQEFLNAIDPVTGRPRFETMMKGMAGNPATALNAQRAAQDAMSLSTADYNLHTARINRGMAGFGQLIADNPGGIPRAAAEAYVQRQVDTGEWPPEVARQIRSQISDNPQENTKLVLQGMARGLTVQTALESSRPGGHYETGAGLAPYTTQSPLTSQPYTAGMTPQPGMGPAAVMSPAQAFQYGVTYEATQDDVNRDPTGQTRIGGKVTLSGPEVIRRLGEGWALPPGARFNIPATPPATTGPNTPPNYGGKPPSPTNKPHLPGRSENLPLPPAYVAPPGAPGVPGTVGALQVPNPQLASANPMAPAVPAAQPPSPAVAGDVAAIMQGMRNAQGAGAPGVQTAQAGQFSYGPGYQDRARMAVSEAALKRAAENAATYNQQRFPFDQALKAYDEGAVTAPGGDLQNQIQGWLRGRLESLGIDAGDLSSNTELNDKLKKYLAQISSGRPGAGRSDASLAEVLAGSANTHINQVAGADVLKAARALDRMNYAEYQAYLQLSPEEQRKYGYYSDWQNDFQKNHDTRAFAFDLYGPKQKQSLIKQLREGTEEDAAKFNRSLALARRLQLLTTTVMP